MSKIQVGEFKILNIEPKIISDISGEDESVGVNSVLYDYDPETSLVSISLCDDFIDGDGKIDLAKIYDFDVIDITDKIEITDIINKKVYYEFIKRFDTHDTLDFDYKIFSGPNGKVGDDIYVYQCSDLQSVMIKHQNKNGLYKRNFFYYKYPVNIIAHIKDIYTHLYETDLNFDMEGNVIRYKAGKNFHALFEHAEYKIMRHAIDYWG